jgi:hypothetical protein
MSDRSPPAIGQRYLLNLTYNNRSAIAVASITIDLSESQLQKLQDLAALHGIAIEVLLKVSL